MSELMDNQVEMELIRQREDINAAIRSNDLPLLAISGPCAPRVRDAHLLVSEGDSLRVLPKTLSGLVTVQRLPVWKPRSNPDDWHGEIMTDPEGIMSLVERQSKNNVSIAIEFGKREHIVDYVPISSFGWIGARNEFDEDLQYDAATIDPLLPLGIKNGLSGDIDQALKNMEWMKEQRGVSGAEIALIYRGGENAKNPNDWEKAYKDAIKRTDGRLIVDIAHGGEMAHDPSGNFTKSVIGQMVCLNHVLKLAQTGVVPAGIMMESSDTESPTDPVIPFIDGINGIVTLRNTLSLGNSNV